MVAREVRRGRQSSRLSSVVGPRSSGLKSPRGGADRGSTMAALLSGPHLVLLLLSITTWTLKAKS